jgi:hypothetical protein
MLRPPWRRTPTVEVSLPGPFQLLALATAAVAAQPTTLDAIRAAPERFDGKWVELTGQVNQCTHFGCALCPEETTDAKSRRCLALDWDRQRGSNREMGADFDPIYRYASVTLVARFDKSCLVGICTDRAPVLFDARVLRVLKRRVSAEGLNGRREIDRMIDAPAEAARPRVALMQGDQPPGANGPRYRVFADRHDPQIERSAIVCRSRGSPDHPGSWPVDETSALFARSTEDRFTCHSAQRKAGQWRIEPD